MLKAPYYAESIPFKSTLCEDSGPDIRMSGPFSVIFAPNKGTNQQLQLWMAEEGYSITIHEDPTGSQGIRTAEDDLNR